MACRVRRVKCDEQKPSCERCIRTGRFCDGYESVFISQQVLRSLRQVAQTDTLAHSSLTSLATSLVITPTLTNSLYRLYLDEPLNGLTAYDREVTMTLFASKTEPAINFALKSMGTLRASLTRYDDVTGIKANSPDALRSGLENYNQAVATLALRLAGGGRTAAETALHCCQVFMSIESLQGNYMAAMQHFIQGVRIMHNFNARAYTDDTGELQPSENPSLPAVDTFVLKLFLAPCPGTRRPSGGTRLVQAEESKIKEIRHSRTQLTTIAKTTLDYLENTVKPVPPATRLRATKETLLIRLARWAQTVPEYPPGSLRVDEAAMFLLHQVLQVILTASLGSEMDMSTTVEAEMDRLLSVADWLNQFRGINGERRPAKLADTPSSGGWTARMERDELRC